MRPLDVRVYDIYKVSTHKLYTHRHASMWINKLKTPNEFVFPSKPLLCVHALEIHERRMQDSCGPELYTKVNSNIDDHFFLYYCMSRHGRLLVSIADIKLKVVYPRLGGRSHACHTQIVHTGRGKPTRNISIWTGWWFVQSTVKQKVACCGWKSPFSPLRTQQWAPDISGGKGTERRERTMALDDQAVLAKFVYL